MKANLKKDLRNILSKIEEAYTAIETLKQDFEEWKDDHDYGWEDTPTGERAEEDLYNIEEFLSDCESLKDNIEDYLNQ